MVSHQFYQILSDGQYLSHEIADKLIGMMAHKVCRHILSEVCTAEWFGIRNWWWNMRWGGTEQFALSLRLVDSEYTVYEDIIELIDVD